MQFAIDGSTSGIQPVNLSNGQASITESNLSVGTHQIVAYYTSNSGSFLGSDNSANPLSFTVNS